MRRNYPAREGEAPAEQSVSGELGSAGASPSGPATADALALHHVHALLWNGTAASAVDLNPTNLPRITDSSANATNGRQQVGVSNPGTNLRRALLWSGSVDSAVDLHPAGFDQSEALGLNDTHQVGWGNSATVAYHALLWSGTADSAVDLHLSLPPGFEASIAYSIDAAGNVFGIASGSPDHLPHAVEWLPHPITPGDADLNGTVDFTDLLALAQHYGQPGGWVNGDFSEDGTVNFTDLLTLAQNYGQSTLAAAAALPEPTFIAIPLIATGLIRRRR